MIFRFEDFYRALQGHRLLDKATLDIDLASRYGILYAIAKNTHPEIAERAAALYIKHWERGSRRFLVACHWIGLDR